MRVLFKNELVGSDATSDSGSLNYLPANIFDPFLKIRFMSQLASDVVTINFPAPVSVNSFWLAYHNITSGSVEFRDGTLTLVKTIDLANADDIKVDYFDEIMVKQIVINMTNDAGAKVFLGGAAAGVYLQLPDPLSAMPLDEIDNSQVSISPDGQTLTNKVQRLRKRAYTLRGFTMPTLAQLLNALPAIGEICWLDAFENSHDTEAPMYCSQTETVQPSRNSQNEYQVTLTFTEAR